MEKPTKVEVGSTWRNPINAHKAACIGFHDDGRARMEFPNGVFLWSTAQVLANLEYLGGPQPEQRWAMLGNCLVDACLYPRGGTQPSPEVPPELTGSIESNEVCVTSGDMVRRFNKAVARQLGGPPPMKSEGGLPAGCLLCGEKCTTNYSCEAHNEVEFWPALKPCIADWAVGKRDFPRPTTPLVPLEGKEPVAAPQGKPHDWSDPYCASKLGDDVVRMCLACGLFEGSKEACAPYDWRMIKEEWIAGQTAANWRQAHEERISDAQRAADDAKVSGANWIQTRKGTQAAQPEGRFQSHLIGQGAIGIWNLREPKP